MARTRDLGSLVVTIGGITATVAEQIRIMREEEHVSERAISYFIGKAIGEYTERPVCVPLKGQTEITLDTPREVCA